MESVTATTTPIPTALIEVLDTHHRLHASLRLTTVGSSCKIGRSVACDIVIDDVHAAAEHTTITLLEDGRVEIRDLGSRNGTRLDRRRVNGVATIAEGRLIIGRTRVRIRTAHTTLVPERLFRRDALQRHSTLLAAIGAILSLGYAAFDQWITAPEPAAPRIFLAVLGTGVVIGVWIGMWGLITRFAHGIWTLRTHIAIAANTIAVCLWGSWLLSLSVFATGWRWLAGVSVGGVVVAIIGALYLHLRKATQLTTRTTAIVAITLPLAVGVAIAWMTQLNDARDVNRVALGAPIYPPETRIESSMELSDYLVHIKSLKREANRKRRASLAEHPLAESE